MRDYFAKNASVWTCMQNLSNWIAAPHNILMLFLALYCTYWAPSPFCMLCTCPKSCFGGLNEQSGYLVPNNQLISAQMESTWILTCALFWKSRDFRDIKNYIRERFKKEGEKLTTTGNMGQHIVFLFLRFCTFFKIFHVRLGKKTKNVSFYRRVCMCKGKTNIC